MPREVHEDGPEATAFAPGPLVQAEQAHIADGGERRGADQVQEGIGTCAHAQGLGEPRPRLAAEGEPDLLHGRPQALAPAPVRHHEFG